jgi:hypothetical protein
MDHTIIDALAEDLRDFFLTAQPAGFSLQADSVRLKHSAEEILSPRLVILTDEPKRQSRMDATANVSVEIEYVTSMDRMPPDQHRADAGILDEWFRAIRPSKRRSVIGTRVYLHEIVVMQPTNSIREESREQVTVLRGELMVTLIHLI